jgi:hypothetical protein
MPRFWGEQFKFDSDEFSQDIEKLQASEQAKYRERPGERTLQHP